MARPWDDRSGHRPARRHAARFNGSVPDDVLTDLAVARAERLLVDGRGARRRGVSAGGPAGSAGCSADDAGRELLFALTDEVLRTPDAAPLDGPAPRPRRRRAPAGAPARRPRRPAPRRLGSTSAPGPVAAIVRRRIRAETRGVIIPAADPAFARHVAGRRGDGFAVNVNLLGEAILGDDEAAARLDAAVRPDPPARRRLRLGEDLGAVRQPRRAGLRPRGRPHRRPPADRLRRRRGRSSRRCSSTSTWRSTATSTSPSTRSAGCSTSRRSAACRPGIVLQAYLPDTHAVLDALLAWVAERHRAGGAPVKVRLVKGANLAMEHVDAELGGWTAGAVRDQGRRRRQLQGAARPAARRRRGRRAASSASAATTCSTWPGRSTSGSAAGSVDAVGIEMLEGMAPPQSRATRGRRRRAAAVHAGRHRRGLRGQHRLPVAAARRERRRRRTSCARCSRSRPARRCGTAERRRFEAAVADRTTVSGRAAPGARTGAHEQRRVRPRRRRSPTSPTPTSPRPPTGPGSASHLRDDRPAAAPRRSITTTDGHRRGRRAGARRAPPQWWATSTGRAAARPRPGRRGDGRRARPDARRDGPRGGQDRARGRPRGVRGDRLRQLGGASARTTLDDLAADGVDADPLGVVLVAGPWNFPTAIPANGVVAALAAGNAVMLKPAPEAVATAVELVRHVHEAGVPRRRRPARALPRRRRRPPPRHPPRRRRRRAHRLLRHGPAVPRLAARPAAAGRDERQERARHHARPPTSTLALRDLVRSAFGHAGQKCSAASLAIVEAPLLRRPAVPASGWPTPCAACASGRRPTWRRWSAR